MDLGHRQAVQAVQAVRRGEVLVQARPDLWDLLAGASDETWVCGLISRRSGWMARSWQSLGPPRTKLGAWWSRLDNLAQVMVTFSGKKVKFTRDVVDLGWSPIFFIPFPTFALIWVWVWVVMHNYSTVQWGDSWSQPSILPESNPSIQSSF